MTIAVYCSAKDQISEEYLRLGDQLGQLIAKAGHTLVYGGATGGLMSRVSQAAKTAGGTVVGVIPQCIIDAHRQADLCDQLYVVNTMSQRKQQMRDLSDCFICMPGSYGTLDEMMDVISSGIVGEHKKPLYIINYQGFYNALYEQIQQMRILRFIPVEESYHPIWVQSIDELFSLIQ